jgi:Raf kinase inhibitor-like YbhB/YbcL family protein
MMPMISVSNASAASLPKHLPSIAKLAALVLLLGTVGGSTASQSHPSTGGHSLMALVLKSPAFAHGAEIPKKHTCEAADVSPALEWSGLPPRTVSFALVMDDPDAPAGTWVHWVLWNLPVGVHELPEAVAKQDQLDDGTRQGRNSFRKIGYNGPCPPRGKPHRYFFRLYALDEKLDLAPGAHSLDLQEAMQGHVILQAEYMGTYRR